MYPLLSMIGTLVPTNGNDDARTVAFEMSSGAAYGFVHEKCRSPRFSHQLMWLESGRKWCQIESFTLTRLDASVSTSPDRLRLKSPSSQSYYHTPIHLPSLTTNTNHSHTYTPPGQQTWRSHGHKTHLISGHSWATTRTTNPSHSPRPRRARSPLVSSLESPEACREPSPASPTWIGYWWLAHRERWAKRRT